MIVVTVGTQFFDELIDEVDRLVADGVVRDQVWAQVGLTKNAPVHIDSVAFDKDLLGKAREADLVITHAGTGSVCEMIELGRPMIAVVNRTKAANHQREFLEQMSELYDFCWVDGPEHLEAALSQARPAKALGESTVGPLAEDIRAALLSA